MENIFILDLSEVYSDQDLTDAQYAIYKQYVWKMDYVKSDGISTGTTLDHSHIELSVPFFTDGFVSFVKHATIDEDSSIELHSDFNDEFIKHRLGQLYLLHSWGN